MVEKIREIAAANLNMDLSVVTAAAKFKEDLEIDSLDLFELTMALEEEYDIEIPAEALETLTCIEEVAKYIEEHKE
ncbi:MAG: acyl carrier protein [Lachnospiraceae bacterium]|nr:acyl carrier protein [Lachnospiraceae bacterium]